MLNEEMQKIMTAALIVCTSERSFELLARCRSTFQPVPISTRSS